MILAATAMGIHEDEFVKTFEVFIQLGAILAIALMYIKRFFRSLTIYFKLITAFLPTAVWACSLTTTSKNTSLIPW